ncbi:MAG TPA: hypothetical protein ENI95_15645 [Chloroflexi bacterium]|nr:hypothetical protein [Chloroflexota bacterium]
MPLFYFKPFKFHPDEEDQHLSAGVDDAKIDVLVILIVGLLATAMFVAFIVLPLVMVLRETLP